MDLLTVLLLALGLSMDAFAVSVTGGLSMKELKLRHAARIALFFGAFQAVMPVAGWFFGMGFREYIQAVDHWVAFGLLSLIGAKMILESFGLGDGKKGAADYQSTRTLVVLAVAASIDALAVGLGLSLVNVPIISPSIIIGCVTFVVCLAGVYVGGRLGHLFERKIEAMGGLILIGIGVKILVEHLA
jgi:putative Mn2+ efflux pump MntP